MARGTWIGMSRFLCVSILLGTAACGGGKGAVIGVANSRNDFREGGIAEELAEALADYDGTPEITDEILAAVFGAIIGRARAGDTEAALIVLRVAEEQREPDEG